MMDAITFTVYGKPQPAGSKRSMLLRGKGGRLILNKTTGEPIINTVDDNDKAVGWKSSIAAAARQAFRGSLLRGPLAVKFVFYRPRPGGHYSKATGLLNKTGRETPQPISKPDVLKLARCAEDALTGVVWLDDAQITKEIIEKEWGEPARVEITIRARKPKADVAPGQLSLLEPKLPY